MEKSENTAHTEDINYLVFIFACVLALCLIFLSNLVLKDFVYPSITHFN